MQSNIFLKNNAFKPFVFFASGALIIALSFWFSSRYPDLSAKASIGTNLSLSSLGFAPIINVPEDSGFWYKVFAETVNWAYTNKNGMGFGFVIGAFFLSILPLLKKIKTGLGPLDSLFGLFVGMPLGVCVNCAAPISKSLLMAGTSVQFALAALIASPAMNIVVLSMAFAIFPTYLVTSKIILTLFFILMLVPLGCRYIFQSDVRKMPESDHGHYFEAIVDVSDRWWPALLWCCKTYFRNLLYILKIALPLMILAGVFGSLLTVTLPLNELYDEPLLEKSWFVLLGFMLVIALFGTFLPSPMAFDVIISAALIMAGFPIHYVAVLFFTLGSFSIYAFFIIWQSISAKAAIYMYFCTVLLGVIIGITTYALHDRQQLNVSQHISNAKLKTPNNTYDPIVNRTDEALTYEQIKHQIYELEIKEFQSSQENLKIYAKPLQHYNDGEVAFEFLSAESVGIKQPYEISYLSYMAFSLPFSTMGIASADIHNDGWPDILIAGDKEINPNLILYTNVNGTHFERQYLPNVGGEEAAVVVALFDMDGDGWSDVVFTTLDGSLYVIYNDKGHFSEESKTLIVKTDSIIINLSFGDIEGDGDLDIFLGNWYAGPNFVNRPESRNSILRSVSSRKYERIMLPGITGETLTSLFHDFNGDGLLDLYVGNDYQDSLYSDQIFEGRSDASMAAANLDHMQGFQGAHSTMSVDIGDINNDLLPDYYIAQIAYSGQYEFAMDEITERQIAIEDYCDIHTKKSGQNIEKCRAETDLQKALGRVSFMGVDDCFLLEDHDSQIKCAIHYQSYTNFCRISILPRQKSIQNHASERYKDFCERIAVPIETLDLKGKAGHIYAANASLGNVLLRSEQLEGQQRNIYFEEADKRQVGFGAWSWNSRFMDLDNDGWQDIYISNGFTYPRTRPTNLFYKNKGEGFYEDFTKQYGLESFSYSSAYTLVDYNLDGINDIISVPTDGAVEILKSSGGAGNSVFFKLRDTTNQNSQAIGAQLIVHYTKNNEPHQQMRYIKGSGGFRSYNQPVAHFGLGDVETINKLEIKWPDKTSNTLRQDFKSGYLYEVKRVSE